jgi:DNA-directed RNA polymerase specialized sigma24 family protein
VLNGTLALFDVRDTEALAAKALDDQLRGMGAVLREHEREDALAFLIATIWEVSLSYDPRRSKCFEHFAYSICRRRAIDWIRKHRGRTRWQWSPTAKHTHAGEIIERERPDILSLDGPERSELEALESRGEIELADSRADLCRVLA